MSSLKYSMMSLVTLSLTSLLICLLQQATALHSENLQCSWCSSFCSFGSVSCSVRLDRTGFVPGEDISVNVHIENLSQRDIVTSVVAMRQIVNLRAHGSGRKSGCDIFSLTGGKVKCGDNAFYHDIIHIPPLPPSGLDGCSIVDVEYVVKVDVHVTGTTSAKLELTVPIIIGTIPLKHFLPQGLFLTSNYQRYDHSNGNIDSFNGDDLKKGQCQHVYQYYKCLFKTSGVSRPGNAEKNTVITSQPIRMDQNNRRSLCNNRIS